MLFLDELPEFARAALEALREPLEIGQITIARAAQRSTFPARFQLIAAMNPCPCGWAGSSQRDCRCTPDQVARYQNKLSGPLLDRIDLHVEVRALPAEELLQAPAGAPSAAIQLRCAEAHARAVARQGCRNATLQGQALEALVPRGGPTSLFLQAAAARLGWTARATHRSMKLARTIADLDAAAEIQIEHVAEALQYRKTLLSVA